MSTMPVDQQVREIYDAMNPRHCHTIILDFLKENKQNLPVLLSLGLAPEQIRKELSNEAFAYFQHVYQEIEKETDPKSILDQLRSHYPTVFKRLMIDMAAQQRLEETRQMGANVYQSLHEKLQKRVVGQDHVAKKLATAIESQIKNPANRTFLFVGPTGIGKTEMAEAVSSLKNEKIEIVKFPMSQYADETHLGTFCGAGSGYKGSSDKPHFVHLLDRFHPVLIKENGSEKVYEVTNAVMLFDEFEKTHPKIKQVMLELFDKGVFKATYSKETEDNSQNVTDTYIFKNTIFIGTSNLYQPQILNAFLNNVPSEKIAEKFVELNKTQPEHDSYSPELLNRMETIPFGPIPKGKQYQEVISGKMENFISDLKAKGFKDVEVRDRTLILGSLEEKLYGNGIGLRKLKEYFLSLQTPINEQLVNLGEPQTKKVILCMKDNKPCMKILTLVKTKFLEIYVDDQPSIEM